MPHREVIYAKCNCKAGAGGCYKHVAAVLYQTVAYKELNIKTVPDGKTCTDRLQRWHVPGEAPNREDTRFSDLTFEQADPEKDKNNSRKRPIVAGRRKFFSLQNVKFHPVDKIKQLSEV